MSNHPEIKLTEYSHGAGCGCKISPAQLAEIVATANPQWKDENLLVGNETSDDAAVYDLGNGTAIISTTDFFMPIVDDPFTFGRIAATNAISDVYAMGGKPIMAIAILGWPVSKLPTEIARQVLEGGRQACQEAGISLAGGHSIDAPEPIFGLAVTGTVCSDRVLKNSSATEGCHLMLSKPLGVGILTTAQKKKLLLPEDEGLAERWMCQLNKLGAELAAIDGVRALTDVTGFGLFGHLIEICEGSGLSAQVAFSKVPVIPEAEKYRMQGAVPGGTQRNFTSYGDKLGELTEVQRDYGCDPQTSGGLLMAVEPAAIDEVITLAAGFGISLSSFGVLVAKKGKAVSLV